MHLEVLFSIGMLASSTVGEPGTHGAGMTGVHGMGVSTPSAAAVAAATAGLAMLRHTAKGGMFTNGLLSMMFAAGMLEPSTLLVGSTFIVLGAAPKVHIIIAPVVTFWLMAARLLAR